MPSLKTLAGLAALALAGAAPTTAQLAGQAGQDPLAIAAGFGPRDAVDLLVAGNIRFAQGRPEHRNAGLHRLADTAGGERPIATILGCADSRLPIERLFDRGIGDLFTVRVIGNLVGQDTTGSIEYGVNALHTPVVVVLGHRGCGAVRAAMNPAGVGGSLRPMIERITPSIEQARASHGGGLAAADEAVRLNVFAQVESLLAQSPSIASAVSEGSVIVTGAVYDVTSGQIEWLGEHPEQASILANAGGFAPSALNRAAPAPQAAPAPIAPQTEPVVAEAPAEPERPAVQPLIRPFTATARPNTAATPNGSQAPRRRFVNVPTRDD